MTDKLRVGIIGAGRIAEIGHLPGFAKAGAEVVALCDVNRTAMERLAEAHQVRRCYADWREMLSDGELDAVSVCAPPAFHREMVIASLEHGYHTLVEKPLALTLDECDQMVEAARKAEALFMVSQNQRFSARHVVARDILNSGRLGTPYMAHAVFGHGGPENWSPTQKWYFDAAARYGVLADLGSHKIDLLRWLLSQDVVEVSAFKTTNEKLTTIDDTAALMLRFSKGTLATIQVSWVYRPGVEDSVSLSCERGVMTIPSSAEQPVRVVEPGKSGSPIESTYGFEPADVPGWFGSIAAFVDAVVNGKPSPVPGEDGRATMAAVLAAYEAIDRQTVVQLR